MKIKKEITICDACRIEIDYEPHRVFGMELCANCDNDFWNGFVRLEGEFEKLVCKNCEKKVQDSFIKWYKEKEND